MEELDKITVAYQENQTQTNEIAAALAKAQGEFEPIKFDAKVTVRPKDPSKASYTFEYATFPCILTATRKALSKNGLALCQTFNNTVLTTRLLHSSGQQITSVIDLPIDDKMNNQDIGGVMTYFKRYAFSAIIGIAAEADDDANGATGNKYEKDKKEPVPQTKPSVKKTAPVVPKSKEADPVTKPEASEPAVAASDYPYGKPEGKALDAGTVKNIIMAFVAEGISEEELQQYSGYPVKEWTLKMKEMALAEYRGLKQKAWTKEQMLSGELNKK